MPQNQLEISPLNYSRIGKLLGISNWFCYNKACDGDIIHYWSDLVCDKCGQERKYHKRPGVTRERILAEKIKWEMTQ